MSYLEVDKQTLSDLGIFSKSGSASIFDSYNKTKTRGGAKKLEGMFEKPLADEHLINDRSAKGSFFSSLALAFPFTAEAGDTFGSYLENDDIRTQLNTSKKALLEKIKDKLAAEKEYVFVNDGVQAALRIFSQLGGFLEEIKPVVLGSPFEQEYLRFLHILAHTDIAELGGIKTNEYRRLSQEKLSELDIRIRFDNRELMLELLELISELDVYITIGEIALKHKFHFAKALPKEKMQLSYSGVYHPGIAHAVGNDVEIEPGKNVVFLTGANMAGKSTLMKSLGITVYLAHIGLPVAAKSFVFSVCEGIYTSINLADNLFAGASHYYAEVLRLKGVAVELSRGKRLFVVFDELFRGTNVKDAYEGTVAVTKAFAAYKDCSFIISTHIIEAGDELKKEHLSIQYQYLPTIMKGEIPEYPRVLKEGITSDRQGMLIIKNEKILDLLDQGIELLTSKVKEKEEETCLL